MLFKFKKNIKKKLNQAYLKKRQLETCFIYVIKKITVMHLNSCAL